MSYGKGEDLGAQKVRMINCTEVYCNKNSALSREHPLARLLWTWYPPDHEKQETLQNYVATSALTILEAELKNVTKHDSIHKP